MLTVSCRTANILPQHAKGVASKSGTCLFSKRNHATTVRKSNLLFPLTHPVARMVARHVPVRRQLWSVAEREDAPGTLRGCEATQQDRRFARQDTRLFEEATHVFQKKCENACSIACSRASISSDDERHGVEGGSSRARRGQERLVRTITLNSTNTSHFQRWRCPERGGGEGIYVMKSILEGRE